jgi:PAS domain S-box-containing protein
MDIGMSLAGWPGDAANWVLLDLLPVGVYACARDGKLVHMNPAGLRMVEAQSPNDVEGRSAFNWVAPEDGDLWRNHHLRVCNGERLSWEFYIIGLAGTRRHMETHAVPLRSFGGADAQLAIIRDVTGRRRYEDALRESEQHMRQVLEALPIAVFTTDAAGKITFCNGAATALAGRQPRPGEDEWFTTWKLRRSDGTPMPHDERPLAMALRDNRLVPGIEALAERPDGKRVPIMVGAASFKDGVEGVAFLVDLSEQKRTQEELRSSEEQYGVVIEAATDVVVTMDERGLILLANPATTKTFGYAPEELIGKPMTMLMPESFRKLHESGFRRYLSTGQRHLNWQGTEVVGLRRNGEEFPVEVSFGELIHNGHKIFTGFIRDISLKKRAEEERERLRRTQSDLAHINRVSTMGELTGSLAHEIKQPIFAAMTDARTCMRWLARDEPDLAEAKEAASRLIKDVTRATEIINRIGALFKRDEQPRELTDINRLILEMMDLLDTEANRYSILIHGNLSKDLPQVMADQVGVQQVLMNLMLNGIEAMKDAGKGGELTIGSQLKDSRELLISVRDTGAGFPPEQAHRIFDAFYTTKTQGTGMGLAITRSIIESHGGRIRARSQPGSGATFEFTLPTENSIDQTV